MMKKLKIEKNKRKELGTVFSNTVMLYILQVSGYIFPLLTFPYLTRVLGPGNYGIMTFANSVMVYFQLLVDFGFLLSATRLCSLFRDDKDRLSETVSAVIQAKIMISGFGFALLLVLCATVGAFSQISLYLIFAYISVFFSVFVPDYLFRGVEKMGTITYRTLIARAIYTVLIFLVVRKAADYYWIPLLNGVSNLFVVLWSWLFVHKELGIRVRRVSFANTLGALRESAIFFVSRLATTAYSASNVFVLGLLFGNASMGLFGASNSLITNARGMYSPIADSLYPYMVSKKNYKLMKWIMIIAAPLVLGGTAFLYVFSVPIIRLLCGDEYLATVPVFRAMLPLMIVTLPIYLLGFPTLGAMNMMKEANYTVIYAAVFHIAGLAVLYLTGHLYFIPVSLLTTGSEIVVLVSRIYYVCKGRKRLREGKSND
jgi:PST family polysaccharide transporter